MSNNSTEDPGKTFVSSRGITLNLRLVSRFKIDAVRSSAEVVEPPTYVMNVVGQDVHYPLDETIAKNKGRMDEWNEYLNKKKIAGQVAAKHFSELLVYEGVDVDVPDENSDWQKQSERFGIKVPADPVERKMLYVFNELVGTKEDLENLIVQILSVSQVEEEVIQRIRDSFRPRKVGNTHKPPVQRQRKVAISKPNVQ